MTRFALLLALLPGFAFADPPKAPETVAAKVGELTRFEVKASAPGAAYVAAFDDADIFFDRLYSDDPLTLRFFVQARKPGRYYVVFWTIGEKSGIRVPIMVEGKLPPQPDPGPGPSPDPGPKPQPVAEPLWLIVVHETKDKTPAVAKVLGDTAFWDSLKAAGNNWRHEDKDIASPIVQSHVARAQEAGVSLPALLFVNNSGTVRKIMPLPGSVDAIRATLKELTGK